MNLKKWLYLFFSTLLVGAAGSLIVGLLLERNLWETSIENIGMALFGHILAGFLFSAVSQMGFFAYLTINRFGLGIFRGRALWQAVQIVLILFTFFDLIYFRYILFASEGEGIMGYIWIPFGLLLYSIAIAYVKAKETNSTAAVPTVFFMFVVTVIEWLPALRENNIKGMMYMLIPLLVCNTWQILQLHKLTRTS